MGYKFYTLKAQALTIRSQMLGLLYYFRGIILPLLHQGHLYLLH